MIIYMAFAITELLDFLLLHFWEPGSIHKMQNVPSEPERARKRREAAFLACQVKFLIEMLTVEKHSNFLSETNNYYAKIFK